MFYREDLFITSKIWNTFHHPSSVQNAIETTLKNLKLSYLDLYLIHWPMSYQVEGNNPASNGEKNANGEFIDGGADYLDTYKAMEKLVDLGLTKSIGVSNFNAQQIDRIMKNGESMRIFTEKKPFLFFIPFFGLFLKLARIFPVTNQVECHPYLNQTKLKKFCEDRNIVLTAYAPLGSPARPWAVAGEF
jgi:aldehyde reductase